MRNTPNTRNTYLSLALVWAGFAIVAFVFGALLFLSGFSDAYFYIVGGLLCIAGGLFTLRAITQYSRYEQFNRYR